MWGDTSYWHRFALFLNIRHFGYLFMYLLALSLEKWLLRSYAHSSIRLCFWYWGIWCLYVFWILTPHCKYLLPFSSLPFTFVDGFFAWALDFSLIRSHLFSFPFVAIAFGQINIAKRHVSEHTVYIFFTNFKVSGLTFQSLIHFEFIFVYVVRKCSSFSLFLVGVQYGQHHLLKKLVFSPF